MGVEYKLEDNYEFFYGGYFSQWWEESFEVNGVLYYTAEQFMMAEKARLFKDAEALANILASKDPKVQKAWGRKVKNFNEAIWNEVKVEIVSQGNLAKFSQNSYLLKALLATGNKILVEASPYDKIWGIGIGKNDSRRFDETQWRGQNLLGKVLTELKGILKAKI